MISQPNLTWSRGDNEVFLVGVGFSYGAYTQYYWVWTSDTYITYPPALWSLLDYGLGGTWVVFGLDQDTGAWDWVGPRRFAKVADTLVSFADGYLEQAVRDAIGMPSGDIAASDLAWQDYLDAYGLEISQLGGIEYALGLRGIDLYDNQIIDLGPLAGLSNLQWLYLGDNQIVELAPLAGLSNLQWLYLCGNQIVDLGPLAGLSTLQTLDLGGNQVVDLDPLAGLSNLQWLDLSDNQITDIAPLLLNTGLGEGDSLYLYGNPLSMQACTVDIPALEARGVSVGHDCDEAARAASETERAAAMPDADVAACRDRLERFEDRMGARELDPERRARLEERLELEAQRCKQRLEKRLEARPAS